MLHSDWMQVKTAHRAQQQPEETQGAGEYAAVGAPAAESTNGPALDLPNFTTDQEEMDEAVSELLFDLELEGLISGLP